MSEPVKAVLSMSLDVDCPECNETFDLFQTSFNNEGELYHQVLDDDRWLIDADERLKTHAYCPHCSAEFEVKGVIW